MSSAYVRGPQNPGAQPIPQGLIARVSGALRAGVSAAAAAWNGWFAPGPPTNPVAPQGTPVRPWDFPVGQNIAQAPKTSEGITYAHLKSMSTNYDLLRLAIETRKDQVARRRWSIKPRGDEKAKPDAATQKRIDEITDFFQRPDRKLAWPQWIRLLMENVFVYDAAAVYRRPTLAGGTFSLEVLNGSTIKRLIDNTGRAPDPPLAAYQQWLYGVPAYDLTTDDLLFVHRNPMPDRIYGYSPVEQVICTANIGLRRLSQQLNFFTEGTMPEGFMTGDPNWGADELEKFQQRFDAYLSGNQKARSRIIMVPSTVKFDFPKTEALFDSFDEWLVRIICYAFSLSPQPFIKMMNRATAESAQEAALEEGLEPTLIFLETILSQCLTDWFDAPDLQWAWESPRDVDPSTESEIDQRYISCGVRSINEVRARLGEDPIDGGDVHGFITASGFVPLLQALEPPPPPPPQLPPAGGKPGQKLLPAAQEPPPKEPVGKLSGTSRYAHEGFHHLAKRLTALEQGKGDSDGR